MKRIILALSFISIIFPVYPSGVLREQAQSYCGQGYKLQSMGNYQDALSFYLKAIGADPSYKEAYNDAGVIYEKMGFLDKAEKMYLEAIRVDSKYLAPYANLGFLYEKKNNVSKASYYWGKRYFLGDRREYWTQKAREHLIKLGAYPRAMRDELEDKALTLSKNLVYKRERQRLKEAWLHFDLGSKALGKGRYQQAEGEFKTVIGLNPSDKKLLNDAQKYYTAAEAAALRKSIKGYMENGLNYLEEKDYLSLLQELRKAMSLVPKIPKE